VVVKDVSFIAPDGAITGILGANGAGKTTVLRMISGVLNPNAGDTYVDGASVHKAFSSVQPQLGSLLDHTGIYSRLTPRENLLLFGKLRNIPSDILAGWVQNTLKLLGLSDLGTRQRLPSPKGNV
jgi:sodium transport system ATP-binding protein